MHRKLVRLHQQCCVQFWSSHPRRALLSLRRFSIELLNLNPFIAGLSYEEQLKETWLYALKRRWLWKDLIETYKIMKEEEFFSRMDSDRNWGHSLRIKQRRVRTVVRQGYSLYCSHCSVLWPFLSVPGCMCSSSNPSLLNIQNPGWLHPSTLLFFTSPIWLTTF